MHLFYSFIQRIFIECLLGVLASGDRAVNKTESTPALEWNVCSCWGGGSNCPAFSPAGLLLPLPLFSPVPEGHGHFPHKVKCGSLANQSIP